MDIISFNEGATANSRIEKINANPDSTSGIVTTPKVIEAGETVTIPAGRVAVLPNLQIDGDLVIDGDVFVPSGATFGDLETQLALKAPLASAALVNPTINGIAQSGYTGFKNYIINGGFDVWQRGTNFSSFISGFSADRWICRAASSLTPSVYTVLRGFSSSYGGYFKLDVSGADSNWYIETHIENPSHFSSKTFTLSFDSIGNALNPSQLFKARVYLYTATNGYSTINTDTIFTMTTSTTRESITFTCPDFSAYTIDSNSYILVGIESGGIIADGTYRFGKIQLEEGSVATPFENRPYGLELSLCQRYYRVIGNANIGLGVKYSISGINKESIDIQFSPMRVSPSITILAEGVYENCSSTQLTATGNNGVVERVTVTATGGYRHIGWIYGLSAEL